MRLLSLSFLAALVVSTLATPTLDATQILEELPPCAISCIVTGFTNSTCSLSDLSCLCDNVSLQAKLTTCVSKACDAHDQSTLDVIENALCAAYPHPSRQMQLVLAGIITVSIIIPIVLLRLFCRVRISKKVGMDDIAIFVATAMLVILTILDILGAEAGFGLHLWNVDPTKISFLLKNFYIAEMIYIAVIAFTKISILLFYLRIFVTKTFRIMTWLTIVFIVLFAIAFILLIGLQCRPIESVWNKSIEGKCIDLSIVAYSSATVSILQDLIILFLPIRDIISLNIGTKRKINVLIMFGVGLFATATSCIRLNFLVQFATSTDETWTNIPATLWSLIEINVGVFCACLPSIRALMVHYFPVAFSSTAQKTESESYQLSSVQKPKFVELRGSSPWPDKNNDIVISSSAINRSKSQTRQADKQKDLDFLNMPEEELQKIYEAQRGERDSTDLRNGAAFQTERLSPLSPEHKKLPQSPLYMSEEAVEAHFRSVVRSDEASFNWDSWAANQTPPLQFDGFLQNKGENSDSRRQR